MVLLPEKKQGFANKLVVNCNHCDWKYSCYTSQTLSPEDKTKGKKPCEINYRTVMAFREIGRGHESLKVFSTVMNMPAPMSRVTYTKINSCLHDAYKQMSDESMKDAARGTQYHK